MSRFYRLTPRAYEDLLNIGVYTQGKWGMEQRNNYLQNLDARFQWLADQPQLGKKRDDVVDGYYSFR